MRSLYFLAAGMFTMGCDDYVVAGLLPGLSASLHTSVAGAAQGITAFSLTYLVCAPVFALLLARRPARQVLVLSLVIFALGNVLTLLSPNVVAYLASRAIAGIGAGMYLPVAVAAATELVAPDAVGRALGMVWGANSAGAVVGVPIGLWLAERVGWQATIGMILGLGAFTLAGVALRLPQVQGSTPPSFEDQRRVLLDRRILAIFGVTCVTATASLGLYDFVTPLQAGRANSADFALTAWNVGGLLGTTVIGQVEDRIGNPRAVMAGILIALFASIAALPFTGGVPVLGLLPFLVWGALGWSVMTPQQMSVMELAPGHEAPMVALTSSAVGLGSVFGPALGGLALAGGFEAHYLPYAAAGLLLCALVWQLVLVQRRQPQQAQEAA